MDDETNLITRAAGMIDGGYSALGRACGVGYRGVQRWERQSRLPLSCVAGFTNYHIDLARAVNNRIQAIEFLAWSRASWQKYYDKKNTD